MRVFLICVFGKCSVWIVFYFFVFVLKYFEVIWFLFVLICFNWMWFFFVFILFKLIDFRIWLSRSDIEIWFGVFELFVFNWKKVYVFFGMCLIKFVFISILRWWFIWGWFCFKICVSLVMVRLVEFRSDRMWRCVCFFIVCKKEISLFMSVLLI